MAAIGSDQGSYPRTIDNGGGETLTFIARRRDEQGEYLEGHNELIVAGVPETGGRRRPETSAFEYFLGEIFASTKRHGGTRPGLFDAAYLSHRYRSEFEILEVPAPVRRFLFPVIVAVGRLLGRHRRFAGAPDPVKR